MFSCVLFFFQPMVRFFLLFILVAGSLSAAFKPFFYTRVPRAKRIVNVVQSFNAKLNSAENSRDAYEFLQNMLAQKALHLGISQTVDLEKNINLVFAINEDLHRIVLKKTLDRVEFHDMIRFGLQVPVRNRRRFEELIAANATKVAQGYQLEQGIYLRMQGEQAIIFNGKDPLDINAAMAAIDNKVPSRPMPENLLNYKIDFPLLEKLWGKDITQFAYLLKKKQPEKPSKKDPFANRFTNNSWVVFYIWELYTKFYLQSYQFNPTPQTGYIQFEEKNNELAFNFKLFGDLGNRPFLKLFNARRAISMRNYLQQGQVDLSLKNPMFYFSMPVPMKDFIATMSNYNGTDIFLVRDVYEALFIVTDFILLEDSKNLFWKNFNGNIDVYVYNQQSKLNYAVVIDIEKHHNLEVYFDKLLRRFNSFENNLKAKKIENQLYELTVDKKTSYLLLQNKVMAIANDRKVIDELVKQKPRSDFVRVSRHAGNIEQNLPVVLKLNLADEQIQKFFGSQPGGQTVQKIKNVFFKLENQTSKEISGRLSFGF